MVLKCFSEGKDKKRNGKTKQRLYWIIWTVLWPMFWDIEPSCNEIIVNISMENFMKPPNKSHKSHCLIFIWIWFIVPIFTTILCFQLIKNDLFKVYQNTVWIQFHELSRALRGQRQLFTTVGQHSTDILWYFEVPRLNSL